MATQRPSSSARTGTTAPTGGPRPRASTGQTAWRALAAGGAALARGAGGRLLAAARSETGRRLARAVALTVALAVLITTLYDRGEAPRAAARPAVATPAAGAPGGTTAPARAGTARRQSPDQVGGLRGRARPPAVGERPAAVAAAWYAAHQGVPATKVEALQQDRLSAREVRVLVLADHGHGRLRTALIRVRLGSDGWRVG